MSHVLNSESVMSALEELSSFEDQQRLWLSDGSSGEVSSLTEATEELFDPWVSKELESGNVPDDLRSAFDQLRYLVRSVPRGITPTDQIEHPTMYAVREAASDLLRQLRERAEEANGSEEHERGK
jgi:hypothetical protein